MTAGNGQLRRTDQRKRGWPEPGPHPLAVHDSDRDREAILGTEARQQAVRTAGRQRLGERTVSRRRGPRGAAGSLIGAVLAAGGARGAYALLRSRPPGGTATWTRTNHRGEPVTLLEGGPPPPPGRAAGRAHPRPRADPGRVW
jgi:hypothetical protein